MNLQETKLNEKSQSPKSYSLWFYSYTITKLRKIEMENRLSSYHSRESGCNGWDRGRVVSLRTIKKKKIGEYFHDFRVCRVILNTTHTSFYKKYIKQNTLKLRNRRYHLKNTIKRKTSSVEEYLPCSKW